MKRYIVMFVFGLVLAMFCDVRAENVLHVQTINHQQLISKLQAQVAKLLSLISGRHGALPAGWKYPGLCRYAKSIVKMMY